METIHSYYTDTAPVDANSYSALSESAEYDVCIIGGGYAGLSTALSLVERGVKNIAVLEANHVGHGCSGRNGGFAFGGYSRDEYSLVKKLGEARAKHLYKYTTDGIELIRQRILKYNIDCDAQWDGVLLCNWFKDQNILKKHQAFMSDKMGVELDYVSPDALRETVNSPLYHGALHEKNAFHFHPLKYTQGLARAIAEQGGTVHEDTPVTHLDTDNAVKVVHTANGAIKAKDIVVCCGGYMDGMYKPLARSMLPIATFVMATEPLGDRLMDAFSTKCAIYDTRYAFDYYRPLPDSRILWGGRITANPNKEMAFDLVNDLVKVFPQLEGVKVDFGWKGYMSWAAHKMPQIGQEKPGVWYGQAYGGHGVAATNITGELIGAAIADKDDRYRDLADSFGLSYAFGKIGLMASEATYAWYQLRDSMR